MQLTEQCISCTLLLILAALLTGARGSAQLYDFGTIASDDQLSSADELYMKVNLTDPLLYLGEPKMELYVSASTIDD